MSSSLQQTSSDEIKLLFLEAEPLLVKETSHPSTSPLIKPLETEPVMVKTSTLRTAKIRPLPSVEDPIYRSSPYLKPPADDIKPPPSAGEEPVRSHRSSPHIRSPAVQIKPLPSVKDALPALRCLTSAPDEVKSLECAPSPPSQSQPAISLSGFCCWDWICGVYREDDLCQWDEGQTKSTTGGWKEANKDVLMVGEWQRGKGASSPSGPGAFTDEDENSKKKADDASRIKLFQFNLPVFLPVASATSKWYKTAIFADQHLFSSWCPSFAVCLSRCHHFWPPTSKPVDPKHCNSCK